MKHRLIPHPRSSPPDITVGAKVTTVGSDVLRFEYVVVGALDAVRFADPMLPERRDGLWQTTCFEAFLAGDAGYVELNFSPSRAHASYRFDGYRDGMAPALDLPVPEIWIERGAARFALVAWLDGRRLLTEVGERMGLSAVIEASDGSRSYWALAHPSGAPDFHHAACFVAAVPAPALP